MSRFEANAGHGEDAAVVRTARPEDAPAIARVEVSAWRDAYPMLLPERFLVGGLDPARRSMAWTRRLDRRSDHETVLVLVDGSAGIVGYAAYGAARGSAAKATAEIYELYLHPDFQGRGFGRRLCAAIAGRLLERGASSLCVEVLEGNNARFFYEALGGRLAARKRHAFAGRKLPTLVYAWDDLRAMGGPG